MLYDRRITTDENGNQVAPTFGQTQTQKLGEKYAQIAINQNSVAMQKVKEMIIGHLDAFAGRGLRKAHFTVPSDMVTYKANILSWLQTEGITAKWESCQREGTWITMEY